MDGVCASIHHRVPSGTLGVTRAVLAVVVAAAFTACSSSAPAATTGTDTGAAATPATPATGQASSDAGGGGPAGSAEATAPAPCTLLTTDELKKAINIDFAPGVLDPVSIGSNLTGRPGAYCTWSPTDKNALVNVTVVVHDSPDDIGTGFDTLKSQPGTTQASGIGDDAYLVHGERVGDNYAVELKKGSWYLEINMSGAEWQPTDAQMTELGKDVASHLP
jgi:hypothetical protein